MHRFGLIHISILTDIKKNCYINITIHHCETIYSINTLKKLHHQAPYREQLHTGDERISKEFMSLKNQQHQYGK